MNTIYFKRTGTEEEIKKYMGFYRDFCQEIFLDGITYEDEMEHLHSEIGEQLLIFNGEDCVGFIDFTHNEKPDCWYISHFYIDPQFREKGIGKNAIHEILPYFENSNVLIFTDSEDERAVGFWKKVFSVYGKSTIPKSEYPEFYDDTIVLGCYVNENPFGPMDLEELIRDGKKKYEEKLELERIRAERAAEQEDEPEETTEEDINVFPEGHVTHIVEEEEESEFVRDMRILEQMQIDAAMESQIAIYRSMGLVP